MALIRDAANNLYGTTNNGGPLDAGVVYKLDTTGNLKVRYAFKGGADGCDPYAGVVGDSAGNFYGTTEGCGTGNTGRGVIGAGVVFKVSPTGQETVLYNFMDGADGGYPHSGVIRDRSGNLYGTTYYGGAWGYGVVYKLKPSAC